MVSTQVTSTVPIVVERRRRRHCRGTLFGFAVASTSLATATIPAPRPPPMSASITTPPAVTPIPA